MVITLYADKERMMKMKMLALAFSTLVAQSAFAAQEVNVYSNRQDELIKPIIQQFEKETGIKVNVVFAKEGLNERLEREGKLSPADLMLTVDISRLTELVDKDLVQPVDSKTLQENIPSTPARSVLASSTPSATKIWSSLNSKEKFVPVVASTSTMWRWFRP